MTGEVAKDILLRLVANFPGLAGEDTDAASGADVVAWLASEIYALGPDPEIAFRVAHGSPDDEVECSSTLI